MWKVIKYLRYMYIMIQLLGGTEHPQTSIASLRIHNLRVLFKCFKL